MPKTKTSGQGRPKGALNRATKSVREIAGQYSAGAIGVLVKIAADTAAPPAARVSAAKEILDRAHGRPSAVAEGIKLPAGDATKRGEAAIKAAMAGELPLDHLTALMNALAQQAKLVEQSELTERLEAIERWLTKERKE